MTSVPLLLARCAALPSTGCCSWAAVLRHSGCVPSVLNGHRSLAGSNLPAASAQAGPPSPGCLRSCCDLRSHTEHFSKRAALRSCRGARTHAHTFADWGNFWKLLSPTEPLSHPIAPLELQLKGVIKEEGGQKGFEIYFFKPQ